MLFVLSPSKTLDLKSQLPDISHSQPRLLDDTAILVAILRNHSTKKMAQLMDISEKLALLNVDRFQRFSLPHLRNDSRPCLNMFKGDVYEAMDISQYGQEEFAYAQKHLRILSGLYGVLRPLDLIQPYRLEMGTRLKVKKTRDLYGFWGERITALLNEDLGAAKVEERVLVNLASEEYFYAVRPVKLGGRVVHMVFKERHKGQLKIIGIHAKKARGLMADYAIKNKVNHLEELKFFTAAGYSYQSELSTENNWIFIR